MITWTRHLACMAMMDMSTVNSPINFKGRDVGVIGGNIKILLKETLGV
jgi:hypothetical protein